MTKFGRRPRQRCPSSAAPWMNRLGEQRRDCSERRCNGRLVVASRRQLISRSVFILSHEEIGLTETCLCCTAARASGKEDLWFCSIRTRGSGEPSDMMLFAQECRLRIGTMAKSRDEAMLTRVPDSSTISRAHRSCVSFAAAKKNRTFPATVGHHMTNTDSTPFMRFVPSIPA